MAFTLERSVAAALEVPAGWALHPALRAPTAVWYAPEWLRTRLLAEDAALLGAILPTRVPTQQGLAASFLNTGGNCRIRLSASADKVFPSSTQATVAVLRRSRDTTVRNSTLFGYNSGAAGADRVQAHAPYSDGNLYWDFGNATAGSGRVSVAFTKSTSWETLVFVAGGGKGREVWRNGVRIVSNTSATGTRNSSSAAVGIGGVLGATNNESDNDDVALFVVSSVAWSDGEIRAWSQSPMAATFAPLPIWLPDAAGGGGQTVAIGQVTETDTAQALTGLLATTIAQVTEADTAQALTALQSLAIAQATEADTAQAFAAQHAAAIGQVSESDLAQAITALQTAAVGQATETDLAQSVSASQLLVASQATETDLAQAVALQAAGVIGQAEETDLAQPASSAQARVAAQATEADLAQPLTGLHTLLIGLATEADLAQAFSPSQPNTLQQAAEVDLAQAFGGAQLAAVGQVLESDSAQPLSPLLSLVAGMVLEIDVAQPLGGLRLGIAQVSEVDVAQPFVALMVGAHTISPRIYFVPDESRTYLVPDENRLYQVPDSDRSYFI